MAVDALLLPRAVGRRDVLSSASKHAPSLQCYGTVTARSEYTRVWSKFRKTNNKAAIFVRVESLDMVRPPTRVGSSCEPVCRVPCVSRLSPRCLGGSKTAGTEPTHRRHDRRSGGARAGWGDITSWGSWLTIPKSIPIRHTVFQGVSYCTCVTTMLRALNLWPPLEVVFSTNS
jgi:hypothetical protein